jgi:hypothetical protein
MFQRLFKLVENVLETQVRWHHLHNSGFKAIVTDMDSKQFSGKILRRLKHLCNTFK